MQSLINVVRNSGATQPIIVDGLQWANDLSGWQSHPLVDPKHQLIAGFHAYPWNACVAQACWNTEIETVTKSVPVIASEIGENDCQANFVTTFLNWAIPRHISALVWTWNNNQGCLSLIRSPASDTTSYGAAIRHYFQRAMK
jgi:hypothetical protein